MSSQRFSLILIIAGLFWLKIETVWKVWLQHTLVSNGRIIRKGTGSFQGFFVRRLEFLTKIVKCAFEQSCSFWHSWGFFDLSVVVQKIDYRLFEVYKTQDRTLWNSHPVFCDGINFVNIVKFSAVVFNIQTCCAWMLNVHNSSRNRHLCLNSTILRLSSNKTMAEAIWVLLADLETCKYYKKIFIYSVIYYWCSLTFGSKNRSQAYWQYKRQ